MPTQDARTQPPGPPPNPPGAPNRSSNTSIQSAPRPLQQSFPALDRQNDRPGSDYNGADADTPNCQCGKPSALRTVKKEGPNLGRRFFGCSVKDGCSFFQWDDQPPGPPPARSFTSSAPRFQQSNATVRPFFLTLNTYFVDIKLSSKNYNYFRHLTFRTNSMAATSNPATN
jgi:hypothetical protein